MYADTDSLITCFTVVFNIFFIAYGDFFLITFPYSISVSEPIIECFK